MNQNRKGQLILIACFMFVSSMVTTFILNLKYINPIIVEESSSSLKSAGAERRLFGHVDIYGFDEESTGFKPEIIDRTFEIDEIISINQHIKWKKSLGWGGECKVDVILTIWATNDGNIHISGDIIFYEGITQGTNEVADDITLETIIVPTGGDLVYHQAHLACSLFF